VRPFFRRVGALGDIELQDSPRWLCRPSIPVLPCFSGLNQSARLGRLSEIRAVKSKFSQAYLDTLFSSPDLSTLVELSGYLYGSEDYNRNEPTYGYPEPVFVFVESLVWFSQAIRSGVWTYYESTPRIRQDAMLDALRRHAPAEFATHYSLGMKNRRGELNTNVVDAWIEDHEEDCNRWLWRLANEHRSAIERLCGQRPIEQ